MKNTVVFPYTTFAEAYRDKFKKIGGTVQAFRYLAKGYKAIEWRRRANENAKLALEEEPLEPKAQDTYGGDSDLCSVYCRTI